MRRIALALFLSLPVGVASAQLKPVDLVEQFGGSVVLIQTRGEDGREGIGTGCIVSASGLVATNFHVVRGAKSITLRLTGGKTVPVTGVTGFDPVNDLAVLKTGALPAPAVQLAPNDLARVGSRVYVIGNPRGLENTISEGLLSGRRELNGSRRIQISAPISPGSSGSPVFDEAGSVIGLAVSQVVDGQNLNFAVPVDFLRPLVTLTVKYSLPEFLRASSSYGEQGERVLHGHDGSVLAVRWSPDGKWLATASADGTARIWDTGTWKQVHTLRHRPAPDRSRLSSVTALGWKGDGSLLASGGWDRHLRIWDPVTGQERKSVPHLDSIGSLSWSPKGGEIATTTLSALHLCDVEQGRLSYTREAKNVVPRHVLWHPRGELVASDQADPQGVAFFDPGQRKDLGVLRLEGGALEGMDWSPDGSRLALAFESGMLGLIELSKPKELHSVAAHEPLEIRRNPISHKSAIFAVAWSPDGKHLATGGADGTIKLWGAADLRITAQWQAHPRVTVEERSPLAGGARALAWSPDGRFLASGQMSGRGPSAVRVWNLGEVAPRLNR